MDDGLRLPGTDIRIGLDPILGFLLPVVGDAIGAASTLSLFWLAIQRGVPRTVLLRMAVNVGLDALIGAIPVLGDLFDVGWKANRRNLKLIEQTLAADGARRAPRTWGDRLFLLAVLTIVASALLLPVLLFAWLMHAVFTR